MGGGFTGPRKDRGSGQVSDCCHAGKGEMGMKRLAYSRAFAGLALVMLSAVLVPPAAAQEGGISGTILDVVGKPWADIPVQIVSDQGAKQETKTDGKGKYNCSNLRSGVYVISLTLPGQK